MDKMKPEPWWPLVWRPPVRTRGGWVQSHPTAYLRGHLYYEMVVKRPDGGLRLIARKSKRAQRAGARTRDLPDNLLAIRCVLINTAYPGGKGDPQT